MTNIKWTKRFTIRIFIFSLWLTIFSASNTVQAGYVLDDFDPHPDHHVHAIVVQPDGKILIGGSFNSVSPNGGAAVTRNGIARFNSDGTLDTAFNPNADSTVFSIALQSDGKILIAGTFFNVGGQSRRYLARLDPTTGAPDAFNPIIENSLRTIAVQPNGKILIGGSFNDINGVSRQGVARLNTDGTLDTSFAADTAATVRIIVLQPDGKILVGGDFTTISGQPRNRIARLDSSNGAIDSFDPNADNSVRTIALQADGKILVGGEFTNIGGQTRNNIARLNVEDGTADSFDPNADTFVFAIAVQSDGMILAGGPFGTIGGQTRDHLARLNPITGAADSFNPDPNSTVNAIAVQTDDKFLAGGVFITIGGQSQHRVARFELDTTPTLTVTNTNDSGAGSLRAAIFTANSTANDDVIGFAIPANDPNCSIDGVCTITLTSGELTVGIMTTSGELTIANPTGPNNLFISGNNVSRVFNLNSDANLTLMGMTVTNGNSSSAGGGISNNGATLTLMNIMVSGNRSSSSGGGISNIASTTILINSVVSNNRANGGGGIYNNSGSIVMLTNSTVSGNLDGGGISNFGGSTISLKNSTVHLNNAFINGGGIYNNSGTTTIINSTISGNSAGSFGGGIYNISGLINLTGVTITNNRSNGATLCSNCTGGVRNESSGTINLNNTIIAGNTVANTSNPPDFSGTIPSTSSYNLIGNNQGMTGITDGTNGNQVGTPANPIDPRLQPIADNGGTTKTHALMFDSPAIDMGNSFGLTTDQRDLTRPVDLDDAAHPNASGGDGADIGAFEAQIEPTDSGIECDVAPRFDGNGSVNPGDITQIQRFAVGLDQPYQSNEFQRADCAPRLAQDGTTLLLGNGSINTGDITQAQRYAVGLDGTPSAAGGPTSAGGSKSALFYKIKRAGSDFPLNRNSIFSSESEASMQAVYELRAVRESLSATTLTVAVRLDTVTSAATLTASVGGTLRFDQTQLSNPTNIRLGSGTPGGISFFANTSDVANGRLGFTINAPVNQTFPTGEQKLLLIDFTLIGTGATVLSFDSSQAQRFIGDVQGNELSNYEFAPTEISLSPASAGVTVSGRVLEGKSNMFSRQNRGVVRAQVSFIDITGARRTTLTNRFGYYRFDRVEAGATYVFEVTAKGRQFAPQIRTVHESIDNLNFSAVP